MASCNSNRSTLVLDAASGDHAAPRMPDAGHVLSAGGSGGNAPPGGAQPGAVFDAGLPQNLNFCALRVGAKCDSNADCPNDKLCCAHFDYASFTYTSIECMESCGGLNQWVVCHNPGESCGGVLVCRQSFAIPFTFISVCAEPQANETFSTVQPESDGRIACGDTSCQVGKEQCCLAAHVDLSFPVPQPETPYCAPLSEACECGHVASTVSKGDEDAGETNLDAGR